jgi:hypothetical protein
VDVVRAIVAPGFLASPAVQVALMVGGVVAVACAVVGVFTVIRGQSFAGHSLSDIGAAGGSAAFLLGVGQLWGFLAVTTVAAGTMELIGVQRARGRDVATGVVLGAGLGLSALLLYFDTTVNNTTGAAITIMFGSMFSLPASTVPVVVALAVVSLALALARPLLLSAVSPDIAAARGGTRPPGRRRLRGGVGAGGGDVLAGHRGDPVHRAVDRADTAPALGRERRKRGDHDRPDCPLCLPDPGSDPVLHQTFVVAVRNDLFCILACGDCSCARSYGHRLLAIDTHDPKPAKLNVPRVAAGSSRAGPVGCFSPPPGWLAR